MRRVSPWLVALVAGACGRVGFDSASHADPGNVHLSSQVVERHVTVPVGFRISDEESREYRPSFDFAIGGGASWAPATLSEPAPESLTSSPEGASYEVVWDSMADVGPVALDGVLFRVVLTSGDVTATAVSEPFRVWNVVRVSVGFTTVCGVRPSGTVDCWGYDREYVLGQGDGVGATPGPVRVVGINDAADVAVTAGYYHGAACVLHQTGAVSCWGGNGHGKLGDGTTESRLTPVPVVGIDDAIALTAGDEFFCALLADQSIRCWGEGAGGKLGNGDVQDATVPVEVSGIDDAVRVVSSGYANHCCALRAGGELVCWGANNYGQLADDTLASSSSPWSIEELSGVTDVAVGEGFTCASTSAGVSCWGENDGGQLGADGSASAQPVEVVDSAGLTRIAAGGANACGIDAAGLVRCWGDDTYNNLQQSHMSDSTVPVPIPALGPVVHISLEGYTHGGPPTALCAVTTRGAIRCWGHNQYGQHGTGERSGSPVPLVATAVAGATDVAISKGFSCALVGGDVYCYGSNNGGSLGVGDTVARAVPAHVEHLTGIVDVVAGMNWHLHGGFACAVNALGDAFCWGGNGSGRLGTGSSSPSVSLTPVPSVSGVAELVLGESHGCARLVDGSVSCWGNGSTGQLGLGSFGGSVTPAQVSLPDTVLDIDTYFRHVCVVLADRRIMCWGESDYGEVGDGTIGNIHTPQFAAGITNGAAVAIGREHTCALLVDETVMCWGANNSGQLGTGPGGSSVPVAVPGLTGVRALALGESHSCALAHDGSVWCWGSNSLGQLGDGTFSTRWQPVRVEAVSDAQAIFAGGANTCARLASGDLVCWGANQFGELGRGSSFLEPSTVPGFP